MVINLSEQIHRHDITCTIGDYTRLVTIEWLNKSDNSFGWCCINQLDFDKIAKEMGYIKLGDQNYE